jgi:three-Cys-motif partner protein
VRRLATNIIVSANSPSFIFIDPSGLAIQRRTMDILLALPWKVDVLFNYMLDGVKRVYGAASSGQNSISQGNTNALNEFFGEDVMISCQKDIENPETYARPVFCMHKMQVVAFHMKWPNKNAIQYILLFASKKDSILKIAKRIYAKEKTEEYGQTSLFGADEYLDHFEVIEP